MMALLWNVKIPQIICPEYLILLLLKKIHSIMDMEKHHYHVSLAWQGERKGKLSSPELPETIQVATPPPFDKGVSGIWSPEHLFTASVVSCFMTTFLAIAEYSKLSFSAFSCEATGTLEKIEGKFMMSEILLRPVLTLPNASDKEKALRILQKSEAACLISNSIKSKVIMQETILTP